MKVLDLSVFGFLLELKAVMVAVVGTSPEILIWPLPFRKIYMGFYHGFFFTWVGKSHFQSSQELKKNVDLIKTTVMLHYNKYNFI